MPRLHIVVRPQPAARGNGQVNAPARSQGAADFMEKSLLIVKVLQHVEEANGRQGSVAETRFLQRRMHHIPQSTRSRVTDAGVSWFDQDHRHSNRLDRRGHEAVAAADVEERSGGGEPAEQGQEAGVAVGKPERTVFEREAGVIAGCGIGDAFRATSAPDAVGLALQALRELREVKRRADSLRTAGKCSSLSQ